MSHSSFHDTIGRTVAVYQGRDTLIYAGLCYGCVGAVAATANVVPRLAVGIYDAFVRDDHALALELQRKLDPLRSAFSLGSFPVVAKDAMALVGQPAGELSSALPRRTLVLIAGRPVEPGSEAGDR